MQRFFLKNKQQLKLDKRLNQLVLTSIQITLTVGGSIIEWLVTSLPVWIQLLH